MIRVRFAAASDAGAMAALYAPYVRDTAITFEYEPPDAGEFCRRIAAVQKDLPWLVAEEDGRLLGYAYVSHFHERAAYAWSAELSIYLDMQARRRGLGRRLYEILLALLRAQGYRTVFALITHPNAGSEAFHRAMGFSPAGVLHNAGSKLGRWWDVTYWELTLAEISPEAPVPSPVQALPAALVEALFATERPEIL